MRVECVEEFKGRKGVAEDVEDGVEGEGHFGCNEARLGRRAVDGLVG